MDVNRDRFVRDWSCAAVLVALCAIAACANPPAAEPSMPFMPFVQIRADLADGTTNAGQGPFKVSYYALGRVLDAATLDQLSARLSLRTWPEGAVVATDVEIGPVLPSNDNVPATIAVAELTPKSALEDRWYSVRFQFDPADNEVRPTPTFGASGIRVRPGSHPAVRFLQFCEPKFAVEFSEPVTSTAPAEMFTITQNGNSVVCNVYQVLPLTLRQTCNMLVRGPLTITLAADKGQGIGGTPLTSGSWNVDTSMLPWVATDCVGYQVEPI